MATDRRLRLATNGTALETTLRQVPGRYRLVYLVALVTLAILGTMAASAAGVPEASETLTPIPDSETGLDNPCRPVMEGLSNRDENLMASTGLDDSIPAFLANDYSPGGLYCLADELAGRVDAVYVEFWQDETLAVTWLSTSPATRAYPWAEYLGSLEGRTSESIITISENEYLAISGGADLASIKRMTETEVESVRVGQLATLSD